MANLTVASQDSMYHIGSQDFCAQCPETEANKKILCLLLRALRDPGTGKALFTHEHIAKALG